ncbi:MAG: hypothetical protein GY679_02935 [Mycoplasma sp.]|nr:hypothetical protein [Mycoplasma sp.]
MSKLAFKTSTKIENYMFEKIMIQTNNYKTKIKANSLHVVSAAKVIIIKKQIVTAFFLIKPIILSDSNGDVVIWTKSTFEQATLQKPFLIKEIEKKNNFDYKIFNSKKVLGLTTNEYLKLSSSKSLKDINKLIQKTLPLDKGGGL